MSQIEYAPEASSTPQPHEVEEEELGLALISREHEDITALLPRLGELHKSLREIGYTERLDVIEDTIGYLCVRLEEAWGEYVVQTGLGKTAMPHHTAPTLVE